MNIQYICEANDEIDRICWRHYGQSSGAVEAVLRANRGLADRLPLLPVGLQIALPVFNGSAAGPSPSAPPVNLWG